MQKAGKMWILDDDEYFKKEFGKSGDQFDIGSLDMALRHIRNWRTAIDGGAHYGTWTREFAREFDQVIAVEPREDLMECLETNTNKCDNVVLIQSALGHESRNVTIGKGQLANNSGTHQVQSTVKKQKVSFPKGDTPLITIDSLELDDVDFIKLDIEGFELFALQGAEETLKRCKPVVHLEDKYHSRRYKINKGEPGKYLKRLGATKIESYKNRDFVYGWK